MSCGMRTGAPRCAGADRCVSYSDGANSVGPVLLDRVAPQASSRSVPPRFFRAATRLGSLAPAHDFTDYIRRSEPFAPLPQFPLPAITQRSSSILRSQASSSSSPAVGSSFENIGRASARAPIRPRSRGERRNSSAAESGSEAEPESRQVDAETNTLLSSSMLREACFRSECSRSECASLRL